MRIIFTVCLSMFLVNFLCAQHDYDNENIIYSYENKVGIGTNDPIYKFHVNGEDILLKRNNSNSLHFRVDANGDAFINNMDNFLQNGSSGNENLFITGRKDLILQTGNAGTSGTERLRIAGLTGYVGINTSEPKTQLDVNGEISWGSEGAKLTANQGASIELRGSGTPFIDFSNSTSDDYDTRFLLLNDDQLTFVGGNLLINKMEQQNTSYRLDVEGSVRANEIVVNTTGADFVFAPEYNLPSLEEVERYIHINQHLPEIPSAKQMQEEGMAVGELNTKLLQKVEELTLYLIKQNEINQKQAEEIEELKERLLNLEQ